MRPENESAQTWAILQPLIVTLIVTAPLLIGPRAMAEIPPLQTCESALAQVQNKIGAFESES